MAADIHETVDGFLGTLKEIAEKYGRDLSYVQTLAGIGCSKKVKKGHYTTPFSAFCGLKLEEQNSGKDTGHKTTLPDLLKARSGELKAEFGTLSHEQKGTLLKNFLQAKAERGDETKKISNVAITKAVNAKLHNISSMCKELNQMFQTETLFLYCRGNTEHSYIPGSFATDGARKWLENADTGCCAPTTAAKQMEGYSVSGCVRRSRKDKSDLARTIYATARSLCRDILKAGLNSILRSRNPYHQDIQVNYLNYESSIVEKYGVALTGWPVTGPVRSPGVLQSKDVIILKQALLENKCGWIILTQEQREERMASNFQRVADGEQVYGPPRKKRAKKDHFVVGEGREALNSSLENQAA